LHSEASYGRPCPAALCPALPLCFACEEARRGAGRVVNIFLFVPM
jgi:hypothetical protein